MTAATNTSALTTAAGIIQARKHDTHPGIYFEDQVYTWQEYYQHAVRYANIVDQLLVDKTPRHVGTLMENRPEYMFIWGACALTGSVQVSLNSTRRGSELAEDVYATDCQFILYGNAEAEIVAQMNLEGVPTYNIDDPSFQERLAGMDCHELESHPEAYDTSTILMMQFTSGSTGRPKAVMVSTGRFALAAAYTWGDIGPEHVAYNAMPLFHSNAILSSWATMLYQGGGFALARRFSASRFLDDVLRYNANFFNYAGRTLSYILSQPERPEESKTKLMYVFGTEATPRDRAEFARRYGVAPIESYGSSEGGLSITRVPGTPEDALGKVQPGMPYRAAVVDPVTLEEKPPAVFGPNGEILNKAEAIGELVALNNGHAFEGYYKDETATAERVRDGHFLSGDLGYADENGYIYFAGRLGDRFRVDGENFSAAPIERIIGRYPRALLAAVYPVPDAISGDQVMLALQLEDDNPFDPEDFAQFLKEQPDLGTKWAPRYVRIVTELPTTATRKIDKPSLRRERWDTSDSVFIRDERGIAYRPVNDTVRHEIREQFKEHGREGALDNA